MTVCHPNTRRLELQAVANARTQRGLSTPLDLALGG